MKRNAWAFIPTLYLAEGFPYIIINVISTVLYAQLEYPNDMITFWTGFLYLPWILKMFWSPFIDARSTKRKWLISAQICLSLIFLAIAVLLGYQLFLKHTLAGNMTFFNLSLVAFFIGAFVSATLDIATDGYYMLALNEQQQSAFVGIRTIFYRLAMILGNGVLLSLTAWLTNVVKNYNWAVLFDFLGILFGVFAFYHTYILPKPTSDGPVANALQTAWADAFKTYFTQKNLLYILLFILLYRIGDALLEKTVPLFLLKEMAIPLSKYGFIKGILGLGGIIAGNLLGGWALGKYGFKKCIWPFAILLNLPNLFYAYIALARPNLTVIAALITFENLGYGMAMMAFSVFVMYISQGTYKTSHYAISTGIMALGMMLPSMFSGWLQTKIGYAPFFIVTSFISLVALCVVPLSQKVEALDGKI
jgi:PAT family beta-lactamase induction signal transducer AmpG